MARFIVRNGRRIYKPSAPVNIFRSPTRGTGGGFRGIVQLIGECDGATPGLHVIEDPNDIKALLRSGPLADAAAKAFNPSNDQVIKAGASIVHALKVNQSTQGARSLYGDEAVLAGTSAAGSTALVVNWTGGGLTASANKKRWLQITFTNRVESRPIVDNAAGNITVLPPFSEAPTAGLTAKILENQLVLTALDSGLHTNDFGWALAAGAETGRVVYTISHPDFPRDEVSPEICGDAFLRLKYKGGAVVANGSGRVEAATLTTITLNVAGAPAANAYDNKVLQFANGLQRLVASHTAADPSVITLAAGHELTQAQADELNALFTAPGTGMIAEVRNVTAATVTITGASGKATGMTGTVAPTADPILSDTFTNLKLHTLRELVSYINQNTAYEATIPPGVNPDTTLPEDFDWGTTAPAGANALIDVRFDDLVSPTSKGLFKQDLHTLVGFINSTSERLSAVRSTAGSTEGKELPALVSTPITLAGGTRGVSVNSDWQAGFNQLLETDNRGHHIVPLISADLVNLGLGSTATLASVAAQLSAHVLACNTTEQMAKGGYFGRAGTRAQLETQGRTFDYEHIAVMGQKVTCLDVDGNLVEHAEWMGAVIGAAMRAGSTEIGEPLTAKKLAITGTSCDTSWKPTKTSDLNALTAAGVMVIIPGESNGGGGFFWMRDLTTFVDDDETDSAIDGNMVEEQRFIADDLPRWVEARFKGKKAKGKSGPRPATVASVRQAVIERANQYRDDPFNVLADSEDPDDPSKIIAGFDRIKVVQSGNVFLISGRFFLTSGIVFLPTDLSVHVPTLTAA